MVPLSPSFPDWLAFTLLALSMVILAFTIVGVVYNITFPHLKDTHKLFRYLLYLPVCLYCLEAIDTSELTNFWASLGYLVVLAVLSVFLLLVNLYFLDEDFTDIKSVSPLGLTLSVF